jgi:hypothetical protein
MLKVRVLAAGSQDFVGPLLDAISGLASCRQTPRNHVDVEDSFSALSKRTRSAGGARMD